MIRFEADTSMPMLVTNDQLFAAHKIIAERPELHYDMIEEVHKLASITRTRLMLIAWPADRERTPSPLRHWIEEDGTVSLVEVCHWITVDDWPAWAL